MPGRYMTPINSIASTAVTAFFFFFQILNFDNLTGPHVKNIPTREATFSQGL